MFPKNFPDLENEISKGGNFPFHRWKVLASGGQCVSLGTDHRRLLHKGESLRCFRDSASVTYGGMLPSGLTLSALRFILSAKSGQSCKQDCETVDFCNSLHIATPAHEEKGHPSDEECPISGRWLCVGLSLDDAVERRRAVRKRHL